MGMAVRQSPSMGVAGGSEAQGEWDMGGGGGAYGKSAAWGRHGGWGMREIEVRLKTRGVSSDFSKIWLARY